MNKYTFENISELKKVLAERAENISTEIMNTVAGVIDDVRKNGDAALYKYSEKFDKVALDNLFVSDEEQERLISLVPQNLKDTIDEAAKNIYAFHERQLQKSWMMSEPGKIMGQIVRPIEKVGLYVPGGTAAYPSSVLMNGIPAKVAGVKSVTIVTPPKKEGINPAVVYAARKAGITKIASVGGAQAVAALAYGPESIPRADKIGPSEVLVIADERANPKYVAADLMSQAEHDPMAAAIIITTSEELAKRVEEEIAIQKQSLARSEIIDRSLDAFGSIILVENLNKAVELSNEIAPEHLELSVANPFEILALVKNAGSIFLGDYSPEPLGDYFAGPNHVLPTNGTARFSSALGVDSFIKKSSYLYYNKEELEKSEKKLEGSRTRRV